MAPTTSSTECPLIFRPPITEYTPSIWLEFFTSYSSDDEVQEKNGKAIEALKDEARSLLMAKENTTPEKLVMIDTLERLGVAYHFEEEIEDQLKEIFKFHSEDENPEKDYDLFTTALQFRLLRSHRHYASSNVFHKFKGEEDNKFKETLINDAKGLLSLYEAAHLRTHGEDILDEAVVFTTHHLNRMVEQLESPLQDQVKRALEQPLFRGVARVEMLYFISFYGKDNSRNESLLKLAKLDYNYVQNIYKKELSELSRWWREFDLTSKLPYARDRVVELYLWAVAFCYRPKYSYARIIATKALQLTGILDDTYDNYATVEEGDLFGKIFQRWDINEIDCLPDYMKVAYKFTLSMYDEHEQVAIKQGKSFAATYAVDAAKQLVRGYVEEMHLYRRQEMPTFEEYLANTLITTCSHVYYTMIFLGVDSATKEIFDWFMSNPKVLVASSNICRLQNNLVSYERESNGGTMLTGVDIYAKQHGISVQETKRRFAELNENGWKDMNTEWLTETRIPKDIMEQIMCYARGSELAYRTCKDGFTHPEEVKRYITALFVDPIII